MKTNLFLKIVILILLPTLIKAQSSNNKIEFASKPFSTNPNTQTDFKITDHIYAKLSLEKPLKDYCGPKFYDIKDHYGISDKNVVRVISFILKFKNESDEYENASGLKADLCLTKDELESKELYFDILPSKEDASSVYTFGGEFFRCVLNSDFAGTKRELKIELHNLNEILNGISGLEFESNFSIDYNGLNNDKQSELFDYNSSASTNAKNNGLKRNVKIGIETAKTLPLPLCFQKGKNIGYKNPENSNAKIIALLKQKYGTTEIINLTFDKPDGVDDFRTLNDANTNIPTCKMGNHVFYFAFKDKDGSYRFAGGTLRRDYVGYGKFGELYVQDYSAIQEGDAKYPLDALRDKDGVYGVFIFDGAKLK